MIPFDPGYGHVKLGRLLLLSALVFGLAAVVLPGTVSAAETAGTVDVDEVRCVQGSVSGKFAAKCYGRLASYGADWSAAAGTVVSVSKAVGAGTSLSSPLVNIYTHRSSGTAEGWNTGIWDMCSTNLQTNDSYKMYFGPLTADAVVGNVPAGAFVIICDYAFLEVSGGVTYTASTVAVSTGAVTSTIGYCTSTNSTTCNTRNYRLFGSVNMPYLGGFGSTAAFMAGAWPTDWFTGGSDGTAPDPFCETLTVPVTNAGVTLLDGESWTATITAHSSYTVRPSDVTMAWRWSFADTWHVWPASAWGSPYAFVNSEGFAVTPSAGFEMRCQQTGETTTYTQPDGTGAQTSAQPARACSLVSITWPQFPLALGESPTFGFRVAAGAPGPTAGVESLGVLFEEDYQSTELVDVPSWMTTALVPVSDTFPAFSGDGGTFAVTVPTLPKTRWASGEVFVVCEDSFGIVRTRSGSTGNGVFIPPGELDDAESYSDRFADCMDSAGLGFNPASWAPWLLNAGICVVELLAVPSQEDVVAWGDSMEALTEEPPGQWIEAGVDYFGDASFSFATWASAGPACFDVIDSEICPRDWDAAGAMPAWAVTLVLFGLWSALIFAVWRFF